MEQVVPTTVHIYYGSHKNGRFSEIKKFTLGDPEARYQARTDKSRLQRERVEGLS